MSLRQAHLYSLASVIPPLVSANVASFSGKSGLETKQNMSEFFDMDKAER